jgi:hypothetical protein
LERKYSRKLERISFDFITRILQPASAPGEKAGVPRTPRNHSPGRS